jgi:hypothetical protein
MQVFLHDFAQFIPDLDSKPGGLLDLHAIDPVVFPAGVSTENWVIVAPEGIARVSSHGKTVIPFMTRSDLFCQLLCLPEVKLTGFLISMFSKPNQGLKFNNRRSTGLKKQLKASPPHHIGTCTVGILRQTEDSLCILWL